MDDASAADERGLLTAGEPAPGVAGPKPLRVLLIRPPGTFSSLVYPDGPWVGVPLALLYLASAARRLPGVEVRLLDALAYPDLARLERQPPPVLFGLDFDEILRRAEEFGPDVIGLSVAAETFFLDALELARRLRERFPAALLIAGGTDVSMQPERYLARAPAFDLLVLGEGEIAFTTLLQRLQQGEEPRTAPGVAWLRDDGTLQRNAPEFLEDLDSIPPLWEGLDFEQYFRLNRLGFPSRQSIDLPGTDRAVTLITSRGCPYRCSFCSIQLTMGHAFRRHSSAFVVAQLALLARDHGVRHVHFEDDNLSLDRERLRAFLEGMVRAGLDLTWDTPNGVRADRFDRELVALCRRTGCVYLMFGIESGSQEVLDTLANKELLLTDVEQTLALCRELELDNNGLFIFGLPGERKETVDQTLRYAFSLFDRFGTVPFFSIYKPYPGTELYSRCERNGWLIDARPYERMGKIPYMLFMPTMVETPELEIWYIVDKYQQYMLRFATKVVLRATRLMGRRPLLMARLTLELIGRLLAAPARFMPTLRAFFWRTLLFPRAQLRLNRRRPPARPPGRS